MFSQVISPRSDESETPDGGTTVVIGGGRLGLALATALSDACHRVTFVDENAAVWADRQFPTLTQPVTNMSTLRSVFDTVHDVDAVIAAGPDSESLLVTHLAALELDDADIVALVDDPSRGSAFEDVEVDLLPIASILADHVRELTRHPSRA